MTFTVNFAFTYHFDEDRVEDIYLDYGENVFLYLAIEGRPEGVVESFNPLSSCSSPHLLCNQDDGLVELLAGEAEEKVVRGKLTCSFFHAGFLGLARVACPAAAASDRRCHHPTRNHGLPNHPPPHFPSVPFFCAWKSGLNLDTAAELDTQAALEKRMHDILVSVFFGRPADYIALTSASATRQ